MSLLLAILYPLAVQYERGGYWRLVAPVTVLALVIDVLGNHTELALLTWDWPRKGEWTFSQRLERLIRSSGWRAGIAIPIANALNWIAPSGRHIA